MNLYCGSREWHELLFLGLSIQLRCMYCENISDNFKQAVAYSMM